MSLVKAAVGVVPLVTAVPPVLPEVVVTLYWIPLTKIDAFLLESIFIASRYNVFASTVIGRALI